jgi:hypothetical protein
MPLSADDKKFLKGIYQELQDRPLEPGDPRYQPVYQHPGCEDPVDLLQRRIEYAETESLTLFSGFRGSGKTTELLRLKKNLEESGHTVLYADALDYVDPANPIEITDLLIIVAGAFSDELEKQRIDIASENYWTRFANWLTRTSVNIKEFGIKAGTDKSGAELKLELHDNPSFRQRLAAALSGRVGELRAEVNQFFEDGFKSVRKQRGEDTRVVFLFDSLEQIRGSLSNEQEVTRSIERLFSSSMLAINNLHVVYTVPPWLKFMLHGMDMIVLPCLRLWENNPPRSCCGPGNDALRALIRKRFSSDGLERFFGPDPLPRAQRLIDLCGGHFRDLLLLLRQTVLRADSLPVSAKAIDGAILNVRSNFLPISLDDAKWLAEIERERKTLLRTTDPADIHRLTRFLDTHVVLYLKNGEEWYDVHPIVRDEVISIAAPGAVVESA